MSIEQYFKTKMPKEDNNESSEVDSDLEEADIEVPNNYRRATQKKLNLKKKKVQLLSKRKTRVFQNEWLNIYKWLIYDGSRNLMFCSLCQSHKKQNKFGKEGSKNFKSSALSEHSTTKDHTDATNREIAKVELIKVTNNAIDRAQNHVSVLMKIIFWLAENDISLNKLPEVVRLCRILDCPQLLSASNTITYENNVSGREILSAISNSIEEIIWKELAEAAAFGIMVDESTDNSCEPHLIIYVKYCLTNKLMSFASDGASVMLGRSTGVASGLKEINECLFITHCIAHRLALACNSAEKKVDFCKHAEHHVIRWLSWYEAIKNLCLSIDTLLETITSTPNNSQRQNFISLYAEIRDWKLLAFLHFLWDILGYLSTLSKIFQRKNIQISDIDPIIELTLNKIQQQFLDYDDDGRLSLGEHLNKFLSHFSEEENNYNIGAHQLLWNENYEADLISDILSFASAVVLEIQERFPDRPLLNSMKILDHANWPSNKEELTNYGEEELNMLSEFYKKEINNICGEWFGYKAIIHSNFRNIKIEKLLPRLFEFYYDTFPNIIKLLGIIYSIPFSSVDCERGFSKQNLIKTDLRNSLNNETLHYWMMVGLEETDLSEFDFTRALQIWNSACKRRI
ncbi:unnamed protein product [Rhizophagus irregularis]|uniref:TTF-type domain-containing protein n=1 Tax=Rhizophagus irregularis TaxID=588596 RepID=A0A916E108_9GLOM|nr:unnamed protein product [Rhizophagus irregularis]CAB5343194.1 unnamed protein product [Rhizophagus irregularis]